MNSNPWVERAWQQITDKLETTSERIGAGFPHAAKEGTYDLMSPTWWTAGFWPGILWLVYRDTGSDKYKALAQECERKLDEVLNRYYPIDHDAGFMWTLTSIASYKLTQDEESKRRALIAASHLAGRFNMKGQFIRAWNGKDQGKTGWAIIDCMMNLPLLYWASDVTEDPRFKHIAAAHADMVLREFVRPDGSTYHIVTFDPETGERTGARGGQGYAEESAWSRGNAWALYGLALSYLHTREERFLQAAKRVAHFFLANLPEDHVPHWDFRAPVSADEETPRDTSAGAIAASGLLELAQLVDPAEARLYQDGGTSILRSLYEKYGAWGKPEEGMLVKGTGHAPAKQNIHVSLIYGDYYFVEGIAKLRGRKELFW
ncbi:glycoside hydrolase family 88 protein [Paenibacillus allorhizosphaerae]|uniref:Unsaturated chondroitin disaccharide hydrolase n=1 Tax=Paenibacillus allorhizosphaerae TaxID=2849866 RepID=A0ABM8VDU9_9BACL|nr:glycoside hydrolase family 88 protein [Paenibacillus allorhizosphaerae]CAG7628705.1 Unsaturated chondroitin disaccharide hydrolase [Paenibacillus allorhizosphaerae]